MKKYLLLILLLVLVTGCSQYEVNLSEVSFDHDEDVDIISYIAENPTEEKLTCELIIKFEGQDAIKDTFNLESKETKELSTRAKLPSGETKLVMQTRCKPRN
jgi:hypothetical protein